MYLTLQVEPDEFRVSAMKNDGTLIDTDFHPGQAPGSGSFQGRKTTP